MAEASNSKINLDRLFNACATRAIMMYRENTTEPKAGHWMCITGGRQAHVNSLQKMLNFFADQLSILKVYLEIEQVVLQVEE